MKRKLLLVLSTLFALTLTSCGDDEPTVKPSPTKDPTVEPSVSPSVTPSVIPTVTPTVEPTVSPTPSETIEPTVTPTPTHTHSSDGWESNENSHWKVCSECNEVYAFDSHNFTLKERKEPNYDEDGYALYVCRVCEYQYRQTLDKLVHQYASAWSVDEEKGTHYHACIDAGYENLRSDEAEHEFEESVVPVSYETDGYTLHKCKVCEYSYKTDVEEKWEHHYSTEWYVDPNKGTHYHICIDEGYEYLYSDEGPHEFVDEVIDPTYTEQGYTLHTCSICSYQYKDNYTDVLPYPIIFKKYNDYVVAEGHNGDFESLIIPETWEGLPVTKIKSYAFKDCFKLKTVVIPDSVTAIEYGAFMNCYSLEEMTMPYAYVDDIYTAKNYSFTKFLGFDNQEYRDYYLEGMGVQYDSFTNRVYQPRYSPKSLKRINITSIDIYNGGFSGMESLEEVVLSDAVAVIGSDAFYNCHNLKRVVYGDNITGIGGRAFNDCTSLESIYVPKDIGQYSAVQFDNNASLKEYVVSEECQYYSAIDGVLLNKDGSKLMRFPMNKSIKGYEFPETVTSLESNSFYGCLHIDGISLPESIIKIPSYAFATSDITSFVVSSTVTSIQEHAFEDCSHLTKFTVGASVTSIGTKAFYNDYKLVTVINKSSLDIIISWSTYGYIAEWAVEVIASEEESAITQDDNYIYCGSTLVSYIGESKEVEIPSTFTTIHFRAFAESDIEKVSIPNSITKYGNETFLNCKNLKEATLEDGLTCLGLAMFFGCSALESLTIPDSIEKVETIFASNVSLKSLDLPYVGMSKSVGDGIGGVLGKLFDDKEDLTPGMEKVVQSWKNSKYDSRTSYMPTSLREITVRSGVINAGAFNAMDFLEKVYLGDEVTEIRSYAFVGCNSLYQIRLGAQMTTISDVAFNGNGGYSGAPESLVSIINDSSLNIVKGSNTYGGIALRSYAIKEIITSSDESGLSRMDNDFIVYTKDDKVTLLAYDGDMSKTVIVPEGITNIYHIARYGRNEIREVICPSTLLTLESSAFAGAERLEYVDLGENIVTIGSSAFSGCISLHAVVVGTHLTSIGYSAFIDCDSNYLEFFYRGYVYEATFTNNDTVSKDAKWYSYSETSTSSNYWHFDENGRAVKNA